MLIYNLSFSKGSSLAFPIRTNSRILVLDLNVTDDLAEFITLQLQHDNK